MLGLGRPAPGISSHLPHSLPPASAPSPSTWALCPPGHGAGGAPLAHPGALSSGLREASPPSACSPPRPLTSLTRCRPRPGSCAGSCRARRPRTWLLAASVLWKLPPVESSQRDRHLCFLHRESPHQGPAPAGGPGGSLLTAPAGLQGPRDWPTEPGPPGHGAAGAHGSLPGSLHAPPSGGCCLVLISGLSGNSQTFRPNAASVAVAPRAVPANSPGAGPSPIPAFPGGGFGEAAGTWPGFLATGCLWALVEARFCVCVWGGSPGRVPAGPMAPGALAAPRHLRAC